MVRQAEILVLECSYRLRDRGLGGAEAQPAA